MSKESELYLSGLSIPEVSKESGVPMSTLRFRFKKMGILRSRADGIRNAASLGKLGEGNRGKKRVFTKEWKENISKGKLGKGVGRSLKPSGYIEITMGKNKGRSEHSVVMEEVMGRRLYANECVHHINEDRSDNRPENLQVMTRSEHAKHHAKTNIKNRNRDKKGRLI